MKLLYTVMICCISLLTSGCSDPQNEAALTAESINSTEKQAAAVSDVSLIKDYAVKIKTGMSKEDVEKITDQIGIPKEGNPRHEQVFYYDYDNSYIQIIYSSDYNNGTFSVSDKRHFIDNLTVQARNTKRHETFSRWVQQRKETIKQTNKTEVEPGPKFLSTYGEPESFRIFEDRLNGVLQKHGLELEDTSSSPYDCGGFILAETKSKEYLAVIIIINHKGHNPHKFKNLVDANVPSGNGYEKFKIDDAYIFLFTGLEELKKGQKNILAKFREAIKEIP